MDGCVRDAKIETCQLHFTKQNLDLIQKNIEQASSLFDSYLDLFRV